MGGGRNAPWIVILYLSLYCATQGLYDTWDEVRKGRRSLGPQRQTLIGKEGNARAHSPSSSPSLRPRPQAFELTYLEKYGVDLGRVAITQTLAIVPWCFKVYISMPSDIMRMRLPFMALGLLISGGMFLVITRMDPNEAFWGYTAAMMARNVGVALADGATEGFSVDCKLDEISGSMQAWMQVGRMTGMILGASVGGLFAERDYYDLLIFLGTAIVCFIPANFLVNEETDPIPYDKDRVWGALFLPFLYSKDVRCALARLVVARVTPALRGLPCL